MNEIINGRKCGCGSSTWSRVGFPTVFNGQRVRCTDCGEENYPKRRHDGILEVMSILSIIPMLLVMLIVLPFLLFIPQSKQQKLNSKIEELFD